MEIGDFDIHLCTLRDNQQFSDDDDIAKNLGITSALWPLFGIIWQSGEILARLMYDYKIDNARILEVGCGIGFASHVLNMRRANISATDYHPEVETFLKENTRINKQKDIPFYLSDWENSTEKLGKFDLIIGSDLLYERGHAVSLSLFIQSLANESCEVIIVDPGRSHQNHFTRELEAFGFVHSKLDPQNLNEAMSSFKGNIHRYIR